MRAHGASLVSHIKSNTVNNEVIPFQIWAFGDAGYDQPCLWKAWNERHGVTYPLFPDGIAQLDLEIMQRCYERCFKTGGGNAIKENTLQAKKKPARKK